MIQVKRVYDAAVPADGFRVLVDRLWPRGLSKERAHLDLWDKDVAPSPTLRTAFHHGGMSWDAFAAAYRAELAGNPAVAALRAVVDDHEVVTVLHAVHDEEHNHAVLLRDTLAGTSL